MFRKTSCVLPFALLLLGQSASAIVSVGPNNDGCHYDYDNIQAAVDHVLGIEQNVPQDADPYISVVGGRVYNEAVVIDGSIVNRYINPLGHQRAFVQIYADYDQACQGKETGTGAEISAGGGKSGNSVIEIKNNVDVVLNHFQLSFATGVANGGGINFHGSGELHLTNTDVAGNHADYGAGIFADGANPGLSVFLHHDTLIEDNTARHAGGGIRIQGHTRLFALEPNTQIYGNEAYPPDDDGTGGGLQVIGPARADLGSMSISHNTARKGAGIAVNVHDYDVAAVRMFRTDPLLPTSIDHNSASNVGGGIYDTAHNIHYTLQDDLNLSGVVCGAGFAINSNTALNGAAVFADGDTTIYGTPVIGGFIDFRVGSVNGGNSDLCSAFEPATVLGGVACAAGASCNQINANRTEDGNGTPTAGSTVWISAGGALKANVIEMRGNRGGHLFQGFRISTQNGPHVFTNALMAENTVTDDLIRTDESSYLQLFNCTITNNAITGAHVITAADSFTMRRSIVWQPSNAILSPSGLGLIYENIASEIATLGNDPSVVAVTDPLFAAPQVGDYTLSQASPAVDFATADGVSAVDIVGNPRNIDLPLPNLLGPIDLGAFELQTFTLPPPPTCVVGDTIFCNGFQPAP